jgi:hypothetical protein
MELAKDVRAEIRHSCPITEGEEAWRVIVAYISDFPDKGRTIKDYYVWVTGEYLEDKEKMTADIESAKSFSLQLAKKRFEESGREVPIENGISCSNEEGVVIVSPKEYLHPQKK